MALHLLVLLLCAFSVLTLQALVLLILLALHTLLLPTIIVLWLRLTLLTFLALLLILLRLRLTFLTLRLLLLRLRLTFLTLRLLLLRLRLRLLLARRSLTTAATATALSVVIIRLLPLAAAITATAPGCHSGRGHKPRGTQYKGGGKTDALDSAKIWNSVEGFHDRSSPV
ncbi:MAG: hypothetical protein ACOH12_06415 [Parvibaculaceae bacterium]